METSVLEVGSSSVCTRKVNTIKGERIGAHHHYYNNNKNIDEYMHTSRLYKWTNLIDKLGG